MNDYSRQSIETKARDAILLLLYMGESSLRADLRNNPEDPKVYSPLAGQTLGIEDLDIKSVGPNRGTGNYHVVASFKANSRHVEAYCTVSCDDQGIFLISNTAIYVGRVWLSPRNVSVNRDGSLDPWAMDEGYDLACAIGASTYQD